MNRGSNTSAYVLLNSLIELGKTRGIIGNQTGLLLKCVERYGKFINISEL